MHEKNTCGATPVHAEQGDRDICQQWINVTFGQPEAEDRVAKRPRDESTFVDLVLLAVLLVSLALGFWS